MAFLCWGAGWGGGACAVSSGCAAGAGPVGRGVALPLSVPLPSLGRQQSGRHWRCAVHRGRGPPYHSGSCSPGFSGYDLCGVPVRRRGSACSSRPPCEPAAGAGGRVTVRLASQAGGAHPPCLGGWGPGPPRRAGWWGGWGGGCRAPASLLSFRAAACGTPFWLSPCRRRAPFRRARAVGAEVPSRGGGGVWGGPWTAPPGAPADLIPPSVTSEWAVVTGGSCGARPPSCSVVRVAPARRCGFAGAGPAAVALTASPFLLRGGRPPGPGGAEGRACGSPAEVGAGGGGAGAAPPPALGPVREGGGGSGGALWSPGDASCRPGGGAAWQSWPRGPAIGRGVAPFPRPPLPRAGFSRRPSLGPLIPRPLSRGAGRPGVAVRVSGQWLAGCGAGGSPPRSLSPHSLPREVARCFPWAGNKAGVTAVVLFMGGVVPHTTPVRAHPASLGTICAASRCAGVGLLVLRGPHVSQRLGRGGGSHSGSPLGRGGSIPPASGGGGRGPRGWRAGGGREGGVAPRPPCSRSGRRPAVLLSGSLRVAGALPSGARVRSGLKCRPGVEGGEGRPVDRSSGGPC